MESEDEKSSANAVGVGCGQEPRFKNQKEEQLPAQAGVK